MSSPVELHSLGRVCGRRAVVQAASPFLSTWLVDPRLARRSGEYEGATPLLPLTGMARGGKCAFFKKRIAVIAVIFYSKRKENFEYWNI